MELICHMMFYSMKTVRDVRMPLVGDITMSEQVLSNDMNCCVGLSVPCINPFGLLSTVFIKLQ